MDIGSRIFSKKFPLNLHFSVRDDKHTAALKIEPGDEGLRLRFFVDRHEIENSLILDSEKVAWVIKGMEEMMECSPSRR